MIATLARTVILYLAVIIGVRIMGKRQIGELQANELVVTILISELAAIPLQDMDRPVSNGLVAIFTLILLELLLSAIALKSSKARRAMSGTPTIVIKDGRIDQKALRSLRMTVDDLLEALRQLNMFYIEDIDFAIVETNGKVSALLRPEKIPATAQMVHSVSPPTGLPCVVVNDGVIQPQSLEFVSMTEADVHQQLKKKHLELKEVFLMIADRTNNVVVVRKDR